MRRGAFQLDSCESVGALPSSLEFTRLICGASALLSLQLLCEQHPRDRASDVVRDEEINSWPWRHCSLCLLDERRDALSAKEVTSYLLYFEQLEQSSEPVLEDNLSAFWLFQDSQRDASFEANMSVALCGQSTTSISR